MMGELLAPCTVTCKTKEHLKGSVIDYFIVSDRIAKCASAANAVTSWPHKPHVPVVITLDGDPRSSKQLVMTTPKNFLKKDP